MAERNGNTAEGQRSGPGEKPDSTGPNARPRDETIAQTGPGIPDDTSAPVEVTPEEERNIEESLRSIGQK